MQSNERFLSILKKDSRKNETYIKKTVSKMKKEEMESLALSAAQTHCSKPIRFNFEDTIVVHRKISNVNGNLGNKFLYTFFVSLNNENNERFLSFLSKFLKYTAKDLYLDRKEDKDYHQYFLFSYQEILSKFINDKNENRKNDFYEMIDDHLSTNKHFFLDVETLKAFLFKINEIVDKKEQACKFVSFLKYSLSKEYREVFANIKDLYMYKIYQKETEYTDCKNIEHLFPDKYKMQSAIETIIDVFLTLEYKLENSNETEAINVYKEFLKENELDFKKDFYKVDKYILFKNLFSEKMDNRYISKIGYSKIKLNEMMKKALDFEIEKNPRYIKGKLIFDLKGASLIYVDPSLNSKVVRRNYLLLEEFDIDRSFNFQNFVGSELTFSDIDTENFQLLSFLERTGVRMNEILEYFNNDCKEKVKAFFDGDLEDIYIDLSQDDYDNIEMRFAK
tara:strand:+ start:59815 stop:61161 length:1347 start_codon:yes stop_codon:yes gene_type:complete